jgi:hypothetical protein
MVIGFFEIFERSEEHGVITQTSVLKQQLLEQDTVPCRRKNSE